MAVDEHAATELSLFIDNDAYMYNRRRSFLDAVKRKIKYNKYDPSKAPKLWQYFVDEGAKRYVKEYGGSVKNNFPVETRRSLAKEYAQTAYHNIKNGEE